MNQDFWLAFLVSGTITGVMTFVSYRIGFRNGFNSAVKIMEALSDEDNQ